VVYILDTDTVGLMWRGQAKVVEKIRLVGGTMKVPLAISLVTYIEIMRGRFSNILTAADSAELQLAVRRYNETVDLLRGLEIVPFDEVALSLFDQLREHKKLKKMGRPDMLIACVALARKTILVTRNTKDFANVPGLTLENWAD
jgi:tRNA(fMet)-specific endonuclease VapC